MLWAQPGIYTWLLAAARRPVAAIATYDAEAALERVLTFGRHGIASSHLRTLATPKQVHHERCEPPEAQHAKTCRWNVAFAAPAADTELECQYGPDDTVPKHLICQDAELFA
jgi:hypothetical protein